VLLFIVLYPSTDYFADMVKYSHKKCFNKYVLVNENTKQT